MSDLIKREDAIEAVWGDDINPSEDGMVFEAQSHIDRDIRLIPSADRPRGEWIMSDIQNEADVLNGNYAYVCTNCNHTDIHAKTQKVPYCWWCGASMKGADDE